MDMSERRARIRANLGIEPITHGQVYTFQIAIPESEQQDISLEKRQLIEDSLTHHKTNLVPLIVRRTEAYNEEEEYEAVYGADWCLVAKELDIEKLWVWVYDMSDEQAAAAKAEMQQLLGFSTSIEKNGSSETDIGSLLEQKLKPIYTKLNQVLTQPAHHTVKPETDEKIIELENQIQRVLTLVKTLNEKIEQVLPQRWNLLEAEKEKIDSALEEAGANTNQRKAIWEAIEYWKQPGKDLTWQNLKKSIDSKEHKIKIFGKGAYEKLKQVTYIPKT
jgi:regulator of replication initiation timing